jgi:hypothetical protein
VFFKYRGYVSKYEAKFLAIRLKNFSQIWGGFSERIFFNRPTENLKFWLGLQLTPRAGRVSVAVSKS